MTRYFHNRVMKLTILRMTPHMTNDKTKCERKKRIWISRGRSAQITQGLFNTHHPPPTEISIHHFIEINIALGYDPP